MGLGQREQGVNRRRPRLARCCIRYICWNPEAILWLLCRNPEAILWLLHRNPEAIPWLIWRDPESIPLLLVVAGGRRLGARFPAAAPFGGSRRGNGLPGGSHGRYRQMT